MISKISKIKGLGLVFTDFAWRAATPAFQAVNLIYGWNGCGKTTLTRLFDEIGERSGAAIEFEVETPDGSLWDQNTDFPDPIRVFNQDYISRNVRILESNANTISILLGEENKDLVAQIEADERDLNGDPSDASKRGRISELDGYTKKKERKEKENEVAFTDIARTIAAAIAGSSSASRNYRSPDAKRDFAKITTPKPLSDAELGDCVLALKQEMLPEVTLIELKSISIDAALATPLSLATQLQTEIAKIVAETVEAEAIARLVQNPDIARWVEEGTRIHTEHGSDACEYCGNALSSKRLSELARHFSDSDQRLKTRLRTALETLERVRNAVSEMTCHDSTRLYQELRSSYELALANLNALKVELISKIDEQRKTLQEKKDRTNESMTLTTTFDVGSIMLALQDINAVISKHNEKSRGFRTIQDDAIGQLKAHYLSTIFEKVTARNKDIEELMPDLERRAKEIAEIKSRISSARAKISSAHKACEEINKGLQTFLGHKEFSFEPETQIVEDETGEKVEATVGYKIMHGTKPAIYLSEGEKTAIAFVYFVVHLNDGQFSKADGIVVVDDPISSLDSNSLYQAFSFLKNAVSGSKQVFVLTHNFEFLKLLLSWRSGARKAKTGFFMIRNTFVGDDRRASIDEMDRELKDYASEYHYVFKKLKEMKAEQDGTIMRAYPVPNMARKVWDAFLMYRVPNGQSPYGKMEELKKEGFDSLKLDAIYKFTNDQSHITGSGFDPSLVPETQKVLGELFEMMKTIAPDHFAVLDKATQL